MDPYYRKVLMFVFLDKIERGTFLIVMRSKVEDSEEEVTLIDRLEGKKETLIFTIHYCQNMEF
jgi:hypothetical protein